jgi:hypothetical protein
MYRASGPNKKRFLRKRQAYAYDAAFSPKTPEEVSKMEHFLIFVAPFLVVALAVGSLFWWGARAPKKQ